MSKYTLGQSDKGLVTGFDFTVIIEGKEHTYFAKYPTPKQIRPLQTGYARLQEIDKIFESKVGKEKEELEKEVKKIGKDIEGVFNALFTPHEGAMPLEEMLDNLPQNQKREFDEKIIKDLIG